MRHSLRNIDRPMSPASLGPRAQRTHMRALRMSAFSIWSYIKRLFGPSVTDSFLNDLQRVHDRSTCPAHRANSMYEFAQANGLKWPKSVPLPPTALD